MRVSPARELVLAAVVSVLLATIDWFPAIRTLDATGFGDWQLVHHNWEAAYVELSRFHEWPLWDPFHCGGVPILGNPESQVYAPWFLLSFAFGTVIAVKLMLLGHCAIALTGMYWLARRRYRLQAPSAALAAVAWACCGCFTWDGAGGHATFMPFAFTPWLSYVLGLRRDWLREALWVSVLLLLTLFEGGTYPLPYFVLWLAVELGSRSMSAAAEGGWRAALRDAPPLLFVASALTAVCGAIRLVPIYFALEAHPRTVPNEDALHLDELWEMFSARSHTWTMPHHRFVWPEYGSYMGVAVLALAFAGMGLSLRRGRLQLWFGLLLYGGLMLGNLGPYAPFTLLHRLPIYDSLRVPSRFAMFVTFYLAVFAAIAFDALLVRLPRPRLARSLAWLATCAVFIDLVVVAWPVAKLWREKPLLREPVAARFHLVRYDYYRYNASYPALNLGTTTCYAGGMNWPESKALWLGPRPQLRLSSPGAGRIVNWSSTPHTFRASIELTAPARVLFNQNFSPDYHTSSGVLVQDRGRLALDLPAGKHQIQVRYRPAVLMPSAAISCGGLSLLGMLFARRRRRRRAV
jgi:hypothetical protein